MSAPAKIAAKTDLRIFMDLPSRGDLRLRACLTLKTGGERIGEVGQPEVVPFLILYHTRFGRTGQTSAPTLQIPARPRRFHRRCADRYADLRIGRNRTSTRRFNAAAMRRSIESE